MSISKDKEETSERLEELVHSSTSSKPLLGKDDPGKVVMEGGKMVDKKDRRMELSISLSRKEIEEDFYAFGTELNPKPKKRSKVVQKQLDVLYPKQVQINFQLPISKDKGVTSERLEELADSSKLSKPLLGKDDLGKAIKQESVVDENDRRKEFSISLSSKEIEEDFHIFKGADPNPKPEKRSKVVQKQLDVLFPKQVQIQMPISKDKGLTSERLEELADSSKSSKPLLGKHGLDKAIKQEIVVDENDRRKEFSISLSRKEIEEDFLIFKGTGPNPKPEKRSKVVQKQLDVLFPKQVQIKMPISKDKGVTSERLEELADSSKSSKLLLGKDDLGKAIKQETVVDENDRRKEFSISLSRKEIEEDLHIFKGTDPNPKPEKRSKVVQKQLDVLFPKQVQIKMPILKDKGVTSERLEELAESSKSSKSLLGKDGLGKAIKQEIVVDEDDRRKEFSISLSSKEIEADLHIFKGIDPNLKPKRRPKVVQKQLDALFPCTRLSEITKDMYKVAE